MREFAVIDLETTGSGRADRIVEVAVVRIDESGQVLDEFESVVNPRRPVPARSSRVHRLHQHHVDGCPTLEMVADRIIEVMDGTHALVAHNAAFENRFLLQELPNFSNDQLPTWICTMHLHGGRRLSDCCKRYAFKISDAHTAMSDAVATAKIFAARLSVDDELQQLTRRLRPLSFPTRGWSAAPVPRDQVYQVVPKDFPAPEFLNAFDAGAEFVLTGAPFNLGTCCLSHDDVSEFLGRFGYAVGDSVTKRRTRAVIAADPHANTSKLARARELGLPIIAACRLANPEQPR